MKVLSVISFLYYIAALWLMSMVKCPHTGKDIHEASLMKLTFKQCRDDCKSNGMCETAVYSKNYRLCELYVHFQSELGEEQIVYNKPPQKLDEQLKCKNCTKNQKCVHTSQSVDGVDLPIRICRNGCGKPPEIPDGMIRGNMYRFGCRVLVECLNSADEATMQCYDDGNWKWTNNPISCTCRHPPSAYKGEIRTTALNDTHVEGNLYCGDGLKVIPERPYTPLRLVCNKETGVWTHIAGTCCEQTVDGTKIKMMTYHSYFHFGIWTAAQTPLSPLQVMSVNYTCFYIHLPAMPRADITVNFINNDTVQAYLIFRNCSTNFSNWTALDCNITSSWTDLEEDKNFPDGTVRPQLYLTMNAKLNDTDIEFAMVDDFENCDTFGAWFMVVGPRGTPCLPENSEHNLDVSDKWFILYSPKRKSLLKSGNMQLAERIEIWTDNLYPGQLK